MQMPKDNPPSYHQVSWASDKSILFKMKRQQEVTAYQIFTEKKEDYWVHCFGLTQGMEAQRELDSHRPK